MSQHPDDPRPGQRERTEAGGHPIAPAGANAEITHTGQTIDAPGGRTRVSAGAGGFTLDARIPAGPIQEKWDNHRFSMKLVNPANRRKYTIIVVGTGLAGGAAAATLGELGYRVKSFCYQDSPRRAHSIAA